MEGHGVAATGGGYHWLGAGEEQLDRALMAGLMLDAALGGFLPRDPLSQGRALKIRVQEALLSHLSGRITLDLFHSLIHTLEKSFSFYFPLRVSLLTQANERAGASLPAARQAHGQGPGSRAVSRNLLTEAIARLEDILPRRPGSKLTGPKLDDFLSRTGGGWFRLRDFQDFFAVDRKTAWEYVQKFLQAGLLIHNQERAAAVRYALADGLLKVRAAAIRAEAAEALASLPSPLAAQVADRLIASGGEPFWEEEWRGLVPASYFRKILSRLTGPESLLEVISTAPGGSLLVRLKKRWLRAASR
jgi:hypothetical protein